jgi:hypothetical protein
MCEHFIDGGPYARRCRIHTYSAHEIMHAVTRNGVCDKFSSRNALGFIVREMERLGGRLMDEHGLFNSESVGIILCQYAQRIKASPDAAKGGKA